MVASQGPETPDRRLDESPRAAYDGPPIILPGLPGHDPCHPSSELLQQLDRTVHGLTSRWYRYPPIDQAVRHRSLSLFEVLEFQIGGSMYGIVLKLAFPEGHDGPPRLSHLVSDGPPEPAE